MKRVFILLSILLLTISCTWEQEVFRGSELGAIVHDYEVGADDTDQFLVEVLSNCSYSVSSVSEANWLKWQKESKNDEGFYVKCEANEGVPRMVRLVMTAHDGTEHRDTVMIKQLGKVTPFMTMDNQGCILSEKSGTVSIPIAANVPAEEISAVVTYMEGDDVWIDDVRVEASGAECSLVIKFGENTAAVTRKATLRISFTDGWDRVTFTDCFLTQKSSLGSVGKVVSFSDLHSLSTEEGTLVSEDLLIEGLVVSDPASGNMGDNTQTSRSTIDYSVSEKTIYLESLDGRYGLRLETILVDENRFERCDKVTLNLRGSKLFRSVVRDAEKDPVYYYLEDITSSMTVSLEKGNEADIPNKTKKIGDLTDDDIFTYVSLSDCEIPVRKGPMTPINEGYANGGNASRCAKYPLLVRDIDGNSLYVYTNTTCPYRRTGKILPYGRGNMKGIVVHELYSRFSWKDNASDDEDTFGNIGKYQIRHTSYSDFDFAETMEQSSFSSLVAEWRYITNDFLKDGAPATAGIDPDALLYHTFEYPANHAQYGNTCIYRAVDFSYLGPIGTNSQSPFGQHHGNENGLGIILADGTDWMGPSFTGINSSYASQINNNATEHRGKGQVPRECGSAWQFWYNRDGATGEMNSIIVRFSTKDIVTDHLSVQYSMLSNVSTSNAESKRQEFGPRFWNLEYSLTDPTGKAGGWTLLERFSIPDLAQWSPSTQLWQLPGYKSMDTPLPVSLCGKEHVYLRFRPEGAVQGTPTEYDAAVESGSTMAWAAMNYLAIRYNK